MGENLLNITFSCGMRKFIHDYFKIYRVFSICYAHQQIIHLELNDLELV
jgi:hypothetical protein